MSNLSTIFPGGYSPSPAAPNKDAILAALPVLFQPDDVVELRAFHRGGKKRTDAGYFDSDHWPALADHAVRLSLAGASVYVTLNPVDPQLLNRYCNRLEAWASATTTDKQTVRRRWLLIDLDPARPAHTSATERQVEAARVKAREISSYLEGMGWPAPAAAESGNGCHLLYSIDLPNNDEETALVKASLGALGELFDDAVIKVDRTVFNSARICKLYGTVANKGDNTPMAPWRLSRMTATPARRLVSAQQLQALAPAHQFGAAVTARVSAAQPGAFDLENFLARHGLAYTHDMHDGSDRFKLAACPFNPEHGKGEAAVFKRASGALGFKCQHDSCNSKGWHDVRDLLDGPRPAQSATNTAAGFLAGLAARAVAPETGEILQTTPAKSGDWPEPTPLPSALPPVQTFSFNLLPDALRPWVADIAERMQCPPDFLAVGAVVAASALVGARVQVQPKAHDDWRVTPNLWGNVVGRPGAMKSPALNEVLKPLKRIEAKKREAYEAQRQEWDVSQRLGKLQEAANENSAKKAVKDGNTDRARELLKAPDLDPEPVAARLIVNDPSVPALGEVMRANPWGVLLERDEIYGLLKGMDGEGKEPDRAFYLTAYDGDKSYTVDRIGRGLNLHIPRLCLAMIGGIQPGRLSEYVRGAVAGGSADDGLIQRFQLIVWPDASPEWKNVDRWPDTPARQAANEVFDRLEELPTPGDEAPAWRFDDAAQAMFDEWRTELELRLRSDALHPALESHLSKNKKTVPALALLFALIDNPDAGQIGEPELTRALMWAEYLETHAMRVYAAGVNPEAEGAALLLKRIKAGDLADKDGVIADTFTTRDVYRKGWAGMTTPDALRKAAEYLCEFDWLRREVVAAGASGGRSSERYRLNPWLLAGGAA